MSKVEKRKVEVVVISDVHLGTYGCRAKELLKYLKSIEPKSLILNGDIVDVWQFSKSYFPKSHYKVLKYITSLLTHGTQVYYITGNHDEMLRRFAGIRLGSLEILNKLVLELDGEKAWIFHGDIFDVTMKHSKWLAKLGGKGYDLLIILNTLVNWFSTKMGRGKISFSKRIKNSVKGAVKHINNFEQVAAEIAISNEYGYVICGHIHQPAMREVSDRNGDKVMYLNSGDWVENLTALEYHKKKWTLYSYMDDKLLHDEKDSSEQEEQELIERNYSEIFNDLVEEFRIVPFNKAVKQDL